MKNILISQIRATRHLKQPRHLVFPLALLLAMQLSLAQSHQPPTRPAVAPLIGQRYPNDANGDRIDDDLLTRANNAIAAEKAAITAEQKFQAQARSSETVNVELVFKEPVTQQQIDTFTALGGEITYFYKAISYGWNGRIPLNKVSAVPAAMGATLVLLNEPKRGEVQLNLATRTGRVRPVWASGFSGSAAGFTGNSNTTIAILDSGVDESHTDLNGRRVFWHDYTSSAYPNPVDIAGHGSHIAGIALGTGASSGAGTGTLKLSVTHNLSTANNGFLTDAMELPTNGVTITETARWNGGSAGGTRLHWARRLRSVPPNSWTSERSVPGTSPLTLSYTTNGFTDRTYSPALIQSNGITDYVITCQIANYPGVDDGVNKMRGVAAGCNWAGAKVTSDTASYTNPDVGAAIDDLVANRALYKIKIMNLSLGGGLDATIRQKVNSAVNNGIIMAVAAGNSAVTRDYGPGVGTNFVTELGRAAMALTVAASSGINQLTDYSREGFLSPGTTLGQEEDYKPDLMAPGGSVWQGYIISVDSNNGDGTAFPDQQANDYKPEYGTSMSTPFAAGCAALVIDAMESSGIAWDFNSSQHARFVKMLLCATASESNTNREAATGLAAPVLQRASSITNGSQVLPPGKDLAEGYGMINPDAAVEAVAVAYTNGMLETATLGATTTDRRAWARSVNLFAGRNFSIVLTNPPTGDFDLYLYSAAPSPYGTPILLASSTQPGNGSNETINYTGASDQSAILVVKRVSGSGTFSLLGNAAPAVDFTVDFSSGTAPLSVHFTNLTTGATDYTWDFGDGNFSTVVNPANTYALPGNYTVTLTAVGPGGTNSLARLTYINVTAPPPIAAFTASPTSGFGDLTVYFTNLSSGATSYLWGFGDYTTSTNENPVHIYTYSDLHNVFDVSLTAFGPGGTNSITLTNLVVVFYPPQPPTPYINVSDYYDPLVGYPPLMIAISGSDNANGIVDSTDPSFLWNFGDNSTGSIGGGGLMPTYHIYTEPGTYTVSLTVTNSAGTNTFTRTNCVVVADWPSMSQPTVSGSNFLFSFPTLPGNTYGYSIYFKDSLSDALWSPGDTYPGDGSIRTVTNSLSNPQRFFRLGVFRNWPTLTLDGVFDGEAGTLHR
jgi:PKD repeat protein